MSIVEDWVLQRVGYPQTRYHLNVMLGNKGNNQKLTVGRKRGTDIICPGKTVSKLHCELEFNDAQWFVKDLGSMNGIYVNRVSIPMQQPKALQVGDCLGIGALENADVDYFLFDVLKLVIKHEDSPPNPSNPAPVNAAVSASSDDNAEKVNVASSTSSVDLAKGSSAPEAAGGLGNDAGGTSTAKQGDKVPITPIPPTNNTVVPLKRTGVASQPRVLTTTPNSTAGTSQSSSSNLQSNNSISSQRTKVASLSSAPTAPPKSTPGRSMPMSSNPQPIGSSIPSQRTSIASQPTPSSTHGTSQSSSNPPPNINSIPPKRTDVASKPSVLAPAPNSTPGSSNPPPNSSSIPSQRTYVVSKPSVLATAPNGTPGTPQLSSSNGSKNINSIPSQRTNVASKPSVLAPPSKSTTATSRSVGVGFKPSIPNPPSNSTPKTSQQVDVGNKQQTSITLSSNNTLKSSPQSGVVSTHPTINTLLTTINPKSVSNCTTKLPVSSQTAGPEPAPRVIEAAGVKPASTMSSSNEKLRSAAATTPATSSTSKEKSHPPTVAAAASATTPTTSCLNKEKSYPPAAANSSNKEKSHLAAPNIQPSTSGVKNVAPVASATATSATACSTPKATALGQLNSKASSKNKMSAKTTKIGESLKPQDQSISKDKTSLPSKASGNSASDRVRVQDSSSSDVTSKESTGNDKKISKNSDSSSKTLPGSPSKAKSSNPILDKKEKPLKTDEELKSKWCLLLNDPKLAANVVSVVRVPKNEYAAAENSRNPVRNRVLKKKRFRRIRIEDSEESENEASHSGKSDGNISSKKKEHQKEHTPSPMVQIPVEALPKPKSSTKEKIQQEAVQASGSEVEDSSIPKKRSNFVCEKFLDRPPPPLNYSQSDVSCGTDRAEVNTLNPSSSNANDHYDSDDSCIWIRDSDEEGQFISVQVKKEPIDEDEGDLVIDLPAATRVSQSSEIDTEENVVQETCSLESSSEEDVEEEFSSQEEDNRAQNYELDEEEPIPSTSKGHDVQTEQLSTTSRGNLPKKPLNEVVKKIKDRNQVKKAVPTAPLHLANPPPGRFPLTTASFPPKVSDQRGHSSDRGSSYQRKIKEISPRSKPEIRKTKKSGDLRSTLSHKQGLEGYVTSVNQAHSKKDGPKVSSSTLDQNQHAQASKSAPEKKSAPSKPAAKITSKSRSDFLVDEMVGKESSSMKGKKRDAPREELRIPKKRKLDTEVSDGTGTSGPSAQAEKRKHSSDEDVSSEGDTTEAYQPPPQFKPIQVRKSRVSESERVASGTQSVPHTKPMIHDKDHAIPLGRKTYHQSSKSHSKDPRQNRDAVKRLRVEAVVQPDTSQPTPDEEAMVAQLSQNIETNQPPPPVIHPISLGISKEVDDEVRQSPDSSSSPSQDVHETIKPVKGILTKGNSRNRGPNRRNIIFKPFDKDVFKDEERRVPYDVLTLVRTIPSRFDPENQPQVEDASLVTTHTTGSTHHPNATAHLIDELKLRVLHWNFSWIEEQERPQMANIELPILQEIKWPEKEKKLDKLSIRPLITDPKNIYSYFRNFCPLLLHEAWIALGRDVEKNVSRPLEFHILVKGEVTPSEGRNEHEHLLECQGIFQGGHMLSDLDLVTMCLSSNPNKEQLTFGIVSSGKWRPFTVVASNTLDPRLVSAAEFSFGRKIIDASDWFYSFRLQIKKVPSPASLNQIYTVTKMTSLRALFVKRLSLNLELDNSPLGGIILEPTKHPDAFSLIPCNESPRGNSELDQIQYSAVQSISKTITSSSAPKIALIQGPPGTGKTRTLVETVAETLYQETRKTAKNPRILVCAPSSSAINEVACRLAIKFPQNIERSSTVKPVNIVLISDQSSIRPDVVSLSLRAKAEEQWKKLARLFPSEHNEYIANYQEELNRLKVKRRDLLADTKNATLVNNDKAKVSARELSEIEDRIEIITKAIANETDAHLKFCERPENQSKIGHWTQFRERVICQADIICVTLTSSRNVVHKELEKIFITKESRDPGALRPFFCCFIDDASKCAESEILFPLGFGINKLILFGDQMSEKSKLGPRRTLPNHQDIIFDTSIFSRLRNYLSILHPEKPIFVLGTQYRMKQSLWQWVSSEFYASNQLPTSKVHCSSKLHPLIALNVLDGKENMNLAKYGQSISNPNEAELVATIVQLLIKVTSSPVRKKTIGVVTYSLEQKKDIQARLQRCGKEADHVTVKTVDQFQGEEKDIIIVSCVRARETPGNLGLVNSLHLTKTALSRAKESLIVCGHSQTLKGSEPWSSFFDYTTRNGWMHFAMSSFTEVMLRNILLQPV